MDNWGVFISFGGLFCTVLINLTVVAVSWGKTKAQSIQLKERLSETNRRLESARTGLEEMGKTVVRLQERSGHFEKTMNEIREDLRGLRRLLEEFMDRQR